MRLFCVDILFCENDVDRKRNGQSPSMTYLKGNTKKFLLSYILPSFTDIDDIESDIPDTHEDKRSPCGQESNENQLLLNESQSKAKVNSYTSDSLFKDFRV